MPYEITFKNDGIEVEARYFGLLKTADIWASYDRRFSDLELVKKYKIIWSDYTDVTDTALDDLDMTDVEALAGIYKKVSSCNQHVIAVAIMPEPFLFGLGRMWEAYIDGIKWMVRIVHTREEAQAFIDECQAIG